MSFSILTSGIDQDALADAIKVDVGATVRTLELVGKNEYCKTVNVNLDDDRDIIVRILNSSLPTWVMESEAATLKYISEKTSIPVPRILHISLQSDSSVGNYILLEKIPGVKLSTIFSTLRPDQQDAIVARIAEWTFELFKHRFSAIGSIYSNADSEFTIGPICRPAFFVMGRGCLDLDRGPFSSARDYFMACAQRELDCARTQVSQGTSVTYQRDIENARFTVERSMTLLIRAIQGCKGLDDEDPETKEFSLSLTELDLSKIYVSLEDPTQMVSLPFWYNVTTRPLWHCANLPSWLSVSLSEGEEIEKERLERIFRSTIRKLEGPDGLFLRTIDLEDTRRAIDDLSEYDAFRDGFLLLPSLESIIATLPGEEDLPGLQALLDPNTLEGRAARIALFTKGVGPWTLAVKGEDFDIRKTALPARPIIPRLESDSLLAN
ncbi:hypothetical protein M422DRAFT_43378 [Sphaerobolus stellatus SS14]|nr:hypothetical protein M422DRAFT_43378 [Sphaerobolus stellatus SS14]